MSISGADRALFARAIDAAETIKGHTAPNPWVGAVVANGSGEIFTGVTSPSHGPHAEAKALAEAGAAAHGATLYCTLEPCSHHGANPPCVDAIVAAGVKRVVVGIEDPDTRVSGNGVAALRAAGIQVDLVDGEEGVAVAEQLAPYLTHRRTGRPLVVLKMATTLDGRIAGPDGSSQWITGAEAREDVHRLRSRCGATVVGAGTARADDPSLTVRLDNYDGPQPERVVVGEIPAGSKVQPALSWSGSLAALIDHLGAEGHLQVLVEGGGKLAGSFHRAGLVDRYVFYLAPALLGGDDGVPVLGGSGASCLEEAWRGSFVSIARLGQDIRVELEGTHVHGND